ncbi:hypothetical protein SKAU_G00123320 [Synaphobranchus kaupii]|uniref:B30.2/SPRY domain-containing protein n=1 Tax=Synaphobranchus kaupii TaxID=118154 RepID=A0A9Q1J297_SYNKA|nr:hypothetical protein SKAU_G00123320 [Synaphobranchus kaupii]
MDILNRSEGEGISSSVKNPEVDGSEHLQTLKRKLTHLTSEIRGLDDILSKKYKIKHQSKDASATNEFVIMGTFEHLAENKNMPQYVPSEQSEQLLDNMTNSLRLGLECLTNALCQLEQLEVPSQDVDTGQNVGAVLQGDQLPAEPSTAAWQQQDVEQTPEDPVTPLQLEGGPSESHSESQGSSMELDPGEEAPAPTTAPAQGASLELDPGEEEAGPSAVLNDCLERLFFSRQKAHRDLTFSDDNCRVQVRRRSLGRPSLSRADHFDISQVMADQEFSSGVHYWEVDTSESDGWAIGVAYPQLGRTENLGRTANSWCLEWSSNKLCFWHNNISEPIKHDRPSKILLNFIKFLNGEHREAERQRSKTVIGDLKHELAIVLDICERLEAMTQRCEIWEEEWAELAVKELSAMEGQCERKERELRAMVELFQEREDQLAAMAFTLQMKEEKMAGLTQLCQEKAENMADLQKLRREGREAGSLFCSISVIRGRPAGITEELVQQLEIYKLKEIVSVLEGETEEKQIILMAQEEEQRETASLRKKLTEISSELADLKKSATSSTHSLSTAQEIIAVEGECMFQTKTASEGHGKEADSVVQREWSELEGYRQQDIAQQHA